MFRTLTSVGILNLLRKLNEMIQEVVFINVYTYIYSVLYLQKINKQ